MIEIYLTYDSSEHPFLSIPLSDVQRLSIRPFKWLRYLMFSICGAKGELSAGPAGPAVDYATTVLVDDTIYYYSTSERFRFVDYKGLNDRVTITTSSVQSGCTGFRDAILERDGSTCVVTREVAGGCDAAHLIPRRKLSEYIHQVVGDRTPIYNNTTPQILSDATRTISGIDDFGNGVLLRKDLYAFLGKGEVAFLKTPNYGLEAADVRRANIQKDHQGPAPTDTFTLHRLKEPARYNSNSDEALANAGQFISTSDLPSIAYRLGLNVDAQFQSTNSLPHCAILDYVYGIAAYNLWSSHSGDSKAHPVVDCYQKERYNNIPPPPPGPRDDDEFTSTSSEEQEDPLDSPYVDPSPKSRRRGPRHHICERTMDMMEETEEKLHSYFARLYGIVPEVAEKEQELKEQEDSRIKVVGWMKTTDT